MSWHVFKRQWTCGIARSRIYGHQEMRATKCPGRYLMSWVQRYRGGLALR